MTFDPTPHRHRTAAVMAGRIHLNNAGAALVPDSVLDVVQSHLRLESMIGGYEASDEAAAGIGQAYGHVASLIDADSRNIAVVENATVGFALALSAFDFRAGDTILTSRNDYISNQLMYLSLAARLGVKLARAADLPEGGVDPDSVRALIRERRPRLVALTWVPTNSGLVQPVAEIGRICEDENVPFLVDACQAVGQIPVDVRELHCDYLSATARKFLRGPRGIGFLYISDRALAAGAHPLYIDMRGALWADDDTFELTPDARRFENWEFPYALLLGMGEAARYAKETGVDTAGAWAAALARHARERLAGLPGVRVLDRGANQCAIVTAEFDGHNADELVRRLREQAINTSVTLREYAVIDMKDKAVRTAIRISPHYYNTTRDIDNAIFALEEFVPQ